MIRPAFLTAAAFVAALSAAQAQDAPAGNAAKGRQVYLADGCYECHGRVGQGGAFTGGLPAPRLAHTALPFDAFKGQLRAPANNMPPYSKVVVPDRQAADIYAFLQSLPAPADAKDIPILNH